MPGGNGDLWDPLSEGGPAGKVQRKRGGPRRGGMEGPAIRGLRPGSGPRSTEEASGAGGGRAGGGLPREGSGRGARGREERAGSGAANGADGSEGLPAREGRVAPLGPGAGVPCSRCPGPAARSRGAPEVRRVAGVGGGRRGSGVWQGRRGSRGGGGPAGSEAPLRAGRGASAVGVPGSHASRGAPARFASAAVSFPPAPRGPGRGRGRAGAPATATGAEARAGTKGGPPPPPPPRSTRANK